MEAYLVIAGLVLSFSLFILAGSFILAVLGLPRDVLRYVGIVVLVLIGVGLIVPRIEGLLESRSPGYPGGGWGPRATASCSGLPSALFTSRAPDR